MDTSKKPREFWINDDLSLGGAVGRMAYSKKEFAEGASLHVIEYSAYKSLAEQNARLHQICTSLMSALEYYQVYYEGDEIHDAGFKAREALAAAKEQLKGIK